MMMKNAQLKQDKIVVAKNVLQRVNAAIPALSYNGGLHTISPNGTIVAQGPLGPRPPCLRASTSCVAASRSSAV